MSQNGLPVALRFASVCLLFPGIMDLGLCLEMGGRGKGRGRVGGCTKTVVVKMGNEGKKESVVFGVTLMTSREGIAYL